MPSVLLAFIVGIGLSIITVIGDTLIKNASLREVLSGRGWLLLISGSIIYGLTAFGWFFIMKKLKLSTLGVLYGVSCIICLTLVSVFYLKERINLMEILGIILAIISLVILYRFA